MNSLREPVLGHVSPDLNPTRACSDQKRAIGLKGRPGMAARQAELSGLCGLALCVAFAMAPAPALATSLQQAWSVCISMDADAGDRVADCSAVIESGQAKGRQLAYAYVSRGRALDKLDNLPGAIADYGAALRLDPGSVSAYYSRALALIGRDDHQNALADLNRAIALSPKVAQFYRDRARVFIKLNDYPRALADHDVAVRLAPRERIVRLEAQGIVVVRERARVIARIELGVAARREAVCVARREPDRDVVIGQRARVVIQLDEDPGAVAIELRHLG